MKTLKEFDYDLWAAEENGSKRYYARIKTTGEESEISLEVMRRLLSREKQMRREFARNQMHGSMLSLDAICDSSEMNGAAWMVDRRQDTEAEVIGTEAGAAFCKLLTPYQLSVFSECLINGKRMTDYAAEHGISKQSVHNTITLIRKKAKIYFG